MFQVYSMMYGRDFIGVNYNDDLTMSSGANWDIIKVYKEVNNLCCFCNDGAYGALDLLWERKPIKEVTMSEVEEKFGCRVKIIND